MSDNNWGPSGSGSNPNRAARRGEKETSSNGRSGARTKKQTLLAAISITAIVAIGAGVGIGFATGASSNVQSITDANAFNTYNLPSVPQGFTAQNVLDGTATSDAIGEYDEAALELSSALSASFGLTFSDPADAVANNMYTIDGKTQILAKQINGKVYNANGQTIKADARAGAIDTINAVVTKYGFDPFVSNMNPDGTDPMASGYVNISGASKKLPGDRFSVEIIDTIPTDGSTVSDSPDVQQPVQVVVVYFTSYPHLDEADTQKFRDAVTADYKKYLEGSLPVPTAPESAPRIKEDTGELQ